MTAKEFSDLFDVLYNNITSNQAPGLNEYEKSVFLTKAQEEIVKNYFNPKANPKGDGFDDSPKRQADFSTLVREGSMKAYTGPGFDKRSTTKRFYYPADVFLVLNEQVYDNTGISYVVDPISFAEYDRLMKKPYKYPPKYQAWRLITNKIGFSSTVVIPITKSALLTNGTGPYIGLVLTVTTSSTLPVNVKVYNTADSGYSLSEDITEHCSPIITTNSSSINITINIPADVDFATYYRCCIENNTALAQYVSLVWPTVSDSLSERDNIAINAQLWDISVQAREIVTEDSANPVVELIGRFSGTITYSIRYVKRPRPIVLVDLNDMGVSINGEPNPTNCELPEQLHDEVLQRAVELAKIAWAGNQEEIASSLMHMTSGQRSE